MTVRVVQNRSYTLEKTLYTGSTPTDPDPDVATAEAVRWSDGTTVNPSVIDAAAGSVLITFTPAQLATLDRLDLTTFATFGGQPQAYRDTIEVVGGQWFSLAELRGLEPLNNATRYPDDR